MKALNLCSSCWHIFCMFPMNLDICCKRGSRRQDIPQPGCSLSHIYCINRILPSFLPSISQVLFVSLRSPLFFYSILNNIFLCRPVFRRTLHRTHRSSEMAFFPFSAPLISGSSPFFYSHQSSI